MRQFVIEFFHHDGAIVVDPKVPLLPAKGFLFLSSEYVSAGVCLSAKTWQNF
jgi:hypothetical protein